MRLRIVLARLMLKFGNFIQSASLMVMRPDDLIEFSRQHYARENVVAGWSSSAVLEENLSQDELELLKKLPYKKGHLLLLGIGGGREAIALAGCGFMVTGVDFIPEMIEMAKRNAAQYGFKIEGLVQEISALNLADAEFDVIWLSSAMYSSVPTCKKRIEMLRRINDALRPNGFFICQFHLSTGKPGSARSEKARKALAWLTLGNLSYESGDMLWQNSEFIHDFLSEKELADEFAAGGFEISYMHFPRQKTRGGAVLRKSGRGLEDTGGRSYQDTGF